MVIPLSVPDSISFEAAIELTQSLLSEIEQGRVSEPELESIITALVQSENGARGFFVSYLTDDREFSDHSSDSVIRALQSSPGIVGELLVKNLVMSTAMILTHGRNQNSAMAESSARVQKRSRSLIQALNRPEIYDRLAQMETTLATGSGEYQTFLDRWKYDAEQRSLMLNAIRETHST